MTGRFGADNFTHDVARSLRRSVRQVQADGLLVAEHGHDATDDLDRDGWHGTMNYAGFTRPVWSWLRAPELDLPDFIGYPGGVPARTGPEAVATMRFFAAMQSWRALANSWTMLGSHDTARIWTVVGDQARMEVAIGMLMTMPGVPMVFAGDEVGLSGVNGEDARRPMPWDGPWNESTLDTFRRLIQVRRATTALRQGGLQWAHVSDDALVYLRETAEERVVVLARRAPGAPLCLDLHAGEATNIYGGATAPREPDGRFALPGDGPTLQLWRLT